MSPTELNFQIFDTAKGDLLRSLHFIQAPSQFRKWRFRDPNSFYPGEHAPEDLHKIVTSQIIKSPRRKQ